MHIRLSCIFPVQTISIVRNPISGGVGGWGLKASSNPFAHTTYHIPESGAGPGLPPQPGLDTPAWDGEAGRSWKIIRSGEHIHDKCEHPNEIRQPTFTRVEHVRRVERER